MSKSSARVRVIQLQEWMKTLKSQRKKPVKPSNTKPSYGRQRCINKSSDMVGFDYNIVFYLVEYYQLVVVFVETTKLISLLQIARICRWPIYYSYRQPGYV